MDIIKIREQPWDVWKSLKARGEHNNLEIATTLRHIILLDELERTLQHTINKSKEERGIKSKEFAKTKDGDILQEVTELKKQIQGDEDLLKKVQEPLEKELLDLPNLLDESVPGMEDTQ